MNIEDYLSKECGVNPNEKIDTNDDSYWKLKDLVAGYIEEEELVENLHLQNVTNSALNKDQERAVWHTVQFICNQQANDPTKLFHKKDVMQMIKDNYVE